MGKWRRRAFGATGQHADLCGELLPFRILPVLVQIDQFAHSLRECGAGLFLELLVGTRSKFHQIDRLYSARLIAAVVAALWAFNPIQLTSVLYVVQRMTSLSSMFVLMALILHIWARQRQGWSWANVVCYVAAWGVLLPLAVLSKETGILYLLYAATYEALLHRNFAGGLDRFAKLYLVLLGLACLGLLLYLGLGPGSGLLGGYRDRTFTLTERVLSEFRIIWAYIGLILNAKSAELWFVSR